MTYAITHESGDVLWTGTDYDKALQACVDMEIVDDRAYRILNAETGEECT